MIDASLRSLTDHQPPWEWMGAKVSNEGDNPFILDLVTEI